MSEEGRGGVLLFQSFFLFSYLKNQVESHPSPFKPQQLAAWVMGTYLTLDRGTLQRLELPTGTLASYRKPQLYDGKSGIDGREVPVRDWVDEGVIGRWAFSSRPIIIKQLGTHTANRCKRNSHSVVDHITKYNEYVHLQLSLPNYSECRIPALKVTKENQTKRYRIMRNKLDWAFSPRIFITVVVTKGRCYASVPNCRYYFLGGRRC